MNCSTISTTNHLNSKEQAIRIRNSPEAQTWKSSEQVHKNMNCSKDLNNCIHSNQ